MHGVHLFQDTAKCVRKASTTLSATEGEVIGPSTKVLPCTQAVERCNGLADLWPCVTQAEGAVGNASLAN